MKEYTVDIIHKLLPKPVTASNAIIYYFFNA